jgi:hypothetical protein
MKAYWGSGGIVPCILYAGTRWNWVVSFTPRPLYPKGKSPWYPLDRRLDGPQSHSGHSGGEEKNFQPPPRIESYDSLLRYLHVISFPAWVASSLQTATFRVSSVWTHFTGYIFPYLHSSIFSCRLDTCFLNWVISALAFFSFACFVLNFLSVHTWLLPYFNSFCFASLLLSHYSFFCFLFACVLVTIGGGIAQRYSAGLRGCMICGSSPGKGWDFSSPPRPDRLWGPANGYRGLFPCG